VGEYEDQSEGDKSHGPLFDFAWWAVRRYRVGYTRLYFLNSTIDYTAAPNLSAPIPYDPRTAKWRQYSLRGNVPVLGERMHARSQTLGTGSSLAARPVQRCTRHSQPRRWRSNGWFRRLGLTVEEHGAFHSAHHFGETITLAHNKARAGHNSIFEQGKQYHRGLRRGGWPQRPPIDLSIQGGPALGCGPRIDPRGLVLHGAAG